MVHTKFDPVLLPAAATAVRHAASVSIHMEPAGHSLLPAAPEMYAPAHDSTARADLGRAAAAVHSSDPSGTAGVPKLYSAEVGYSAAA